MFENEALHEKLFATPSCYFFFLDILPIVNKYHKIYDLYALWIGHDLSVFVKTPEDAETYCNSYKLIHRGSKVKFFYPILGKGLLFAGGTHITTK